VRSDVQNHRRAEYFKATGAHAFDAPQPAERPGGAPSAAWIAARIERLPGRAAGAAASKYGAE